MLVSNFFSTSALLLGLSVTNVVANMKCDGPDPRQGKEVLVCADGNFLTWSARDCANACSCKDGEISCEIPSDCAPEDKININDYCASGMKNDWVCDCNNQKKDVIPEQASIPHTHTGTAVTTMPSLPAGAPGPVSIGAPTTLSTSVVPHVSPGQSPNKPPNPIVPGLADCDRAGQTCDPGQPKKCCSCQCIYGWTIGYVCGGGLCQSEDQLELGSIPIGPHNHTTPSNSPSLPAGTPGLVSIDPPTSSSDDGSSTQTHMHTHATVSRTGTPSAIPKYEHTTESMPSPPPTGLPPYNPSVPTPAGNNNATTTEPHHRFPPGFHTPPADETVVSAMLN